jgi:queuine tRNA-ribosyltransferase
MISDMDNSIPPTGTFEIFSSEGNARCGRFHTHSGHFDTPAFMPVGTQGTVKGMTAQMLEDTGAQIVLSNTYHLHLRPGEKVIQELGGIHSFMNWKGPILTDSGGFQVFSLSSLRKLSEEGVRFRSHHDGVEVFFTPEKVVEIQETLGVDIMMVLDECLPADAKLEEVRSSWDRTLRWAERSLNAKKNPQTLSFGIVQGGMYEDERARAVEELTKLPFPGFAIGGLSVGEEKGLMRSITSFTAPLLPYKKPRYLMGVGTPLDILESIYAGIDMFDCVIPTRSARFGRIFTMEGYFNIRNSKFRTDPKPLETGCNCYACRYHSRAYISHLIHGNEILGSVLASLHNLMFYQRLVKLVREKITSGTFTAFLEECRLKWQG